MKNSIICCLAMMWLLSASGCAIKNNVPRSCSTLNVVYLDRVPGENGAGQEGIFSITNAGKVSVRFPLDPGSRKHIHTQYATPEERSSSEGSWRMFNPVLEEVMWWSSYITIKPGQERKITYYANGLFEGNQFPKGFEYSIVVKDLAGCTYRSAPFALDR